MVDVKTYVTVNDQPLDSDVYQFPENDIFREAWSLSDNQVIIVDVEKAKEVWKNRMREARVIVFKRLDADYFRALETSNTGWQSEIASTKRLLRDVTNLPELLNATTIEEIESVWPDYLDTQGVKE